MTISQKNIKTKLSLFLFSFIISISVITSEFSAAQPAIDKRTKDILRSIDDLWRGSSSHSINTMRVKTKHYTRTMRIEGWSKGTEKSLMRILSLLKEKGTVTLKSGNSIYTYLPKTDRKIRLTTGMMMGSWMGSHLTNDDLVKEARLEDDYIATISFEGSRDKNNIIEFTLIPKSDAAVVWGKVLLIVHANNYIPITQIYFDEDMKIVRTFTFTDLKLLAGRKRPSVMRVVPKDKPDEFTEFIYEPLELNVDLQDQFFSVSNLKRC